MTREQDGKLATLAASPVGNGRSVAELRALGRLADLAVVPAGTVLQREGAWAPWSYCLLGGAALLSASDVPLAVAGGGAWLLGAGHTPGGGGGPVPVTVVTATDTPTLCFRPADFDAARRELPGLMPILPRQ
ncbi:MAG: hypothetical protein ACRD0G_17865 [Acidimicrobiales bacterium]